MRKIIFGILFILLINFVSGQLADSPWPMFHQTAAHGGLSPYDTSYVDGTVKWTFEAGGGIESSPVIGIDSTIYFGSHDGYLYAISQDGEVKWKTKIGTPIEKPGYGGLSSTGSTPAIAKDGTIYIASRDQYLFAVSPEGKEKWKFPIGVAYDSWASPAIGEDGTIYMTSASPKGGVYAINQDGTQKWHYHVDMGTSNSPVIGKDGTIYAGFPTGFKTNALLALNPDGTKKWELATKFLESTPTVTGDTIYIGTYTDEATGAGLYAISISDKKIKWHLTLQEKEIMTTPAIAKDGTIYFGTVYGKFYAANPDGTIKWSFDAGKELDSSAAIGADGTIYFGSNSGIFYALNPDGTEKWRYSAGSIASSPAIDKDGTVYVSSWDGKLYAFGSTNNKKERFEQNAIRISDDYIVNALFFGETARSCLDSGCTAKKETCIRWNKNMDKCYEYKETCFSQSCSKYKIYCEIAVVSQDEEAVEITFNSNYETTEGTTHLVQKQSFSFEPKGGRAVTWEYDVDVDNIGKCSYSELKVNGEEKKEIAPYCEKEVCGVSETTEDCNGGCDEYNNSIYNANTECGNSICETGEESYCRDDCGGIEKVRIKKSILNMILDLFKRMFR